MVSIALTKGTSWSRAPNSRLGVNLEVLVSWMRWWRHLYLGQSLS